MFHATIRTTIFSFVFQTMIVGTIACNSDPAQGDTYQVTTYVTKVQEERRSTRWTLTEWLRIKERMRMMDVWLAMFSQPKQEHFRPEFNLTYYQLVGQAVRTGSAVDETSEETGVTSGTQAVASLWLTNLISASTGIRTLNVDLGFDGRVNRGGDWQNETAAIDGSGEETGFIGSNKGMTSQAYGANLRLLGKNSQDTSLILKFGQYSVTSGLPVSEETGLAAGPVSGPMRGAELNFYLLGFLGFEGSYLAYENASQPSTVDELNGSYYDYKGFVEVSLLRLMVGRYQEQWNITSQGNKTQVTEQGLLAGVRLQF